MSKKEIGLYFFLLIVASLLKYGYLSDIQYTSLDILYYKSIFSFEDGSSWYNFVNLLPVFIQQLFICKYLYEKAFQFHVRYQNRWRYLKTILWKSFLFSFIFSVIFFFSQITISIFFFKEKWIFSLFLVKIFVKFIIEMYCIHVLILIGSFYLHHFSYTYLLFVIGFIFSLNSFRSIYLPLISLFIDTKFHIFFFFYFGF